MPNKFKKNNFLYNKVYRRKIGQGQQQLLHNEAMGQQETNQVILYKGNTGYVQ